jgi:hypothetical protein
VFIFSLRKLAWDKRLCCCCCYHRRLEYEYCNTLKFASLEIELKWFNFEFLCSWKHREIIFFTKLKFIIRCSNIVVHTCWCICVLYCLVLTKDQNEFKLFFQNEFRSIFLLGYTYIIFLQSNSLFLICQSTSINFSRIFPTFL